MNLRLGKIRDVSGNLMIAVMINLHLINYALVAARGTTTGFSTIIYLGFFVVAIVVWIVQGKLKLDFKWLVAFAVLIIWHLCNASLSRINLLMLCAYVGMPFFIISNIKYKTERVLFYTIIVSIVFIPGFSIMMARTKNSIVDVDVAYSVLPSIIAGIVHFAYFRKQIKKFELLAYLISLFYLLQLFLNGLRGPLMCILITILLIYLFRFDKNDRLQFKQMNLGILIAILIAIFIVLFFESFLQLIVSLFQMLNIDAYFVTKTIRLLRQGDIMNGRNELWRVAWNGFLNSPIWGNGFDSFQHHTGYVYPHNFVLQSLYDGGLLFFIPLFCIVSIGSYRAIKSGNKETIAMYIFLCGFGMVYSFLSQDMYNIFYLWATVAFLLMQHRTKKIRRRIKND